MEVLVTRPARNQVLSYSNIEQTPNTPRASQSSPEQSKENISRYEIILQQITCSSSFITNSLFQINPHSCYEGRVYSWAPTSLA